MKRSIRTLVLSLILTVAMAPAALAVQPSNTNADNRDGGVRDFGPHCHFVLPADGKSPHDRIIAGTIHFAHVTTGLSGGVFEATDCPVN